MLIGHFAVALGAKKIAPQISLGTLFIACQLLDLVWPIAVLLGIEHVAYSHSVPTYNFLHLSYIPYSHSLLMACIWGLVFCLGLAFKNRNLKQIFTVFMVVLSHWILDLIVHIPDLQLWFGSQRYGLGLWNSAHYTYLFETTLLAIGITLYLRHQQIWQLLKPAFLMLVIALQSSFTYHTYFFRPEESNSGMTVAGPAFLLWGIVDWGYFIDQKKPPHAF